MSHRTHPLIGKTIISVFLSTDQEAIKFLFSDETDITANTEGDCCSHTWIEEVDSPEVLIGAVVDSVENVELPDEFQHTTKTSNYEEEMQYYGLEIRTGKGRCLIAYRNSSNGYYGGSLCWPGDYGHWTHKFSAQSKPEDWQRIA